MTNSVPEKLGKYKIIEEVGRGGFAAVYQAVDTTLNRTVALKVLAPHLLWDPTFVQRFQREAEVAANLDHPNIVTIYEVGQVEGVYFIAMQFLEGRTLSQILEAEGPLPVSRVQAILEQIASALDYAHARGFVHRDIKPSNVIVAEDGRATLTDFGLVKAGEGTRLSTTGVVFGTPEYMSPEQAEGKALDARSDVYSLGVVLFEMLAGRAPFVADTTPAVMYKHVHEPPPLDELPSDLPQGAVAVVEKALAKQQEARYQSAGEMARALTAAIEAKAEPKVERKEPKPLTVRPAPKAVSKKALGGGVLLAGGLALLALVACIAIFAIIWPWPTPTPEPPTAAPMVRVTTPAPAVAPTARPILPTDTPTPVPTPSPTHTPTQVSIVVAPLPTPTPTPTTPMPTDTPQPTDTPTPTATLPPSSGLEMPEALNTPGVLVGSGFLSKELFVQDTHLGTITDIVMGELDPSSGPEIGLVGSNGALFLDEKSDVKSSTVFNVQAGHVEIIDADGDSICEYLDRGGGWQDVSLIDHTGNAMWTYGGRPAVNNICAGDIDGDGSLEFVAGFNGSGGVRLLDRNGEEKWAQSDRNVWHVELVDTTGDGSLEIVHSNADGNITIRDGRGAIVDQAKPVPYFSDFSICRWPSEKDREYILFSENDTIWLLDFHGKTVAQLNAPLSGTLGDARGVPIKILPNQPEYFAVVVTFSNWKKSILYLYGLDDSLVYQEVVPEACASISAVSFDSIDQDTLLVGCYGKVWKYVNN